MREKPQIRFIDILRLSELYCKQYTERNLCLSRLQNDVFFRDFVGQYYAALFWGKEPSLVIKTNAPLF